MTRLAAALGAGLMSLSVAPFARADAVLGDAAGLLRLDTIATGLELPTDFRVLPDGRIVIAQLGGRVLLRALDGAVKEIGFIAAVQPPKNSEMGLFSVEVHPDFVDNHLLYFYYARSDEAGGSDLGRNRLVTIPLGPDDTLDMASETVLLDRLQGSWNHHGGGIGIGPDRKLYLGVGDAGCVAGRPPDPSTSPANFFPTCLTNLHGKILRLELDGSIPADNPLSTVDAVSACGATCDIDVSTTGLAVPERAIFAWGFRNPFRLWVDPVTGLPWVGDVGELTYEEIDVVRAGQHYGWPWREASLGWPSEQCSTTVPGGTCVDPVYECQHGTSGPDSGCVALIGGAIVDGCSWPDEFRGRYFFADSGNGTISSLRPSTDRRSVLPGSRKDVAVMRMPVSLRPGPLGDLYVLDLYGRLAVLSPTSRVSCGLETNSVAPKPALAEVEPTVPPPQTNPTCGCRTGASAAVLPWPIVVASLIRRRGRRMPAGTTAVG